MKNTLFLLLLTCLFCFPSCEKDFEELNKNPFNPTQTEIGPLFNSVVSSITLTGDEQLYLHNETLYKITQQAALSAPTFQNVSIGTESVWKRYYAALTDVRDIENRIATYEGEAEGMNNMRAMLKTILAYKTFRLTDLFGDMPFFEAGKGFENLNLVRPPFDSQESIYKFLLEELKWVNDNANTDASPMTTSGEAYYSLNGFDVLFDEDITKWVKFANSLRLRHAMRIAEKEPTLAAAVIEDILGNNLPLLETADDNIGMWPKDLLWINTGVFWSFREHRKLRMGSNIWHKMSENDEIDGSGIFDSRARIFFETNNNDEWVAFPQVPNSDTPVSGGGPYEQARDVNYNLKGQANIYSNFNYYLIRDQDYIPELIMTAAEVNFLKAEAYVRGLGTAVNESQARAEYDAGIGKSILFWHNEIVNKTDIWLNKPPALDPQDQWDTINHDKVKFSNATDTEEKLALIYTQRWIDAFRQPWEAYALGRRTMATPTEGDRAAHYRFPYPPSEIENNPENWNAQVAAMGDDSELVKVWWMRD